MSYDRPSPQDSSAAHDAAAPSPSIQHESLSSLPSAEATDIPFEPLFTLLTNTTKGTTIHPRVHYIFTDDDPAVIPPSDPSHRSIIVDLIPADTAKASSSDPTAPAWKVGWAGSSGPDFAITSSTLTAEQQHGSDAILRLEGVDREPVDMKQREGESEERLEEDKEWLVEEFRRRMDVLKQVVVEGERMDAALDLVQDDPAYGGSREALPRNE